MEGGRKKETRRRHQNGLGSRNISRLVGARSRRPKCEVIAYLRRKKQVQPGFTTGGRGGIGFSRHREKRKNHAGRAEKEKNSGHAVKWAKASHGIDATHAEAAERRVVGPGQGEKKSYALLRPIHHLGGCRPSDLKTTSKTTRLSNKREKKVPLNCLLQEPRQKGGFKS